MKQTVTITLAFLITLCVQAQDFNSSMAEIMKNMKAYTVELVALMPEENFDFRPMDSIRTFHKQVQHMISTNHFLLTHYLKGEEKDRCTNRPPECPGILKKIQQNRVASDLK
jgi:hypothetical protein